ncbi:MAG: hypothetical protein HQ582_34845 [Planctomycetes bacterium]|nr:hypothetical protein [Planctomycetota bacterium]
MTLTTAIGSNGDKFKSKATLESGNLDVLTMAPLYLPDEGIENFVRLASEKSPQIRVLVQEFWSPIATTRRSMVAVRSAYRCRLR